MGLDNYFVLHKKGEEKKEPLYLAHFRKFYELDDWMMSNAPHINDYEVSVTEDLLRKLFEEVDPIVDELHMLGNQTLAYYDENGYPKKYQIKFYNKCFSPVDSRSYGAGSKLCYLYSILEALLEILAHNSDDCYITFYSSF